MTEYETTPGVDIPEPVDETPGAKDEGARGAEAWEQVMRSFDDLGKSVSGWANAVKDDPANRKRAEELRAGLEDMGKQVGVAVDRATKSDFAEHVGSAATTTGGIFFDSAKRFGEEVGPHVAGAMVAVADGLRDAIEGLRARTTSSAQPAPPAEPQHAQTPPGPTPAPAAYTGEEPPAPAPSGVHEE